MSIETAIYTAITSDSGLSAIVGTRVYQVKMPDNVTMPAISYQTLSGTVVESFTGFSNLSSPIISLDCWAKSAGVAKDMATKLRTLFLGLTGSYGDTRIENVLEWSYTDLYDADTEVFHVSCSARFWHS